MYSPYGGLEQNGVETPHSIGRAGTPAHVTVFAHRRDRREHNATQRNATKRRPAVQKERENRRGRLQNPQWRRRLRVGMES